MVCEVKGVKAVGCDPAIWVVCAVITSDDTLWCPRSCGMGSGECNVLCSEGTEMSYEWFQSQWGNGGVWLSCVQGLIC